MKTRTAVFFISLSLTLVCHAADYEEVSYNDLLNQINTRKQSISSSSEPNAFDQVKIHTGVGYINSFSQMQIQNRNVQRYQNGMQLTLGVDLFSENWFGETNFRNFGITTYGSEELLLKEFDMKLGYKASVRPPLSFRMQAGLANRYLTITDHNRDIHISDTTPMVTGSAGLLMELNKVVGIAFDFSARSAMIDRTADKSALDFTFELRAAL